MFCSKVKQSTVWFFSGSGSTAFLQSMGMSLSEAANKDLSACIYSFSGTRFNYFSLNNNIFHFFQVAFGEHKWRSTHYSVAFVCVGLLVTSIFQIVKNESECEVNFCRTLEVVEKKIMFILDT